MRTHNLVASINVKSVTLTCLQLRSLKYSSGPRIGALEMVNTIMNESHCTLQLLLNDIVNLDCFTSSCDRWATFFKQKSWLTLPQAGMATQYWGERGLQRRENTNLMKKKKTTRYCTRVAVTWHLKDECALLIILPFHLSTRFFKWKGHSKSCLYIRGDLKEGKG